MSRSASQATTRDRIEALRLVSAYLSPRELTGGPLRSRDCRIYCSGKTRARALAAPGDSQCCISICTHAPSRACMRARFYRAYRERRKKKTTSIKVPGDVDENTSTVRACQDGNTPAQHCRIHSAAGRLLPDKQDASATGDHIRYTLCRP